MRILVLVTALTAIIACNDSLANHGQSETFVTKKPGDTQFGPAALRSLAALSKEDRAQLASVLAREADQAGLAAPKIEFVLLDKNLPEDVVAAIVENPRTPGSRYVVISKRNNSDAVFALVMQAFGNSEIVAALDEHKTVRLTSIATVVDSKSKTLAQLNQPAEELTRTSETFQHLTTTATSVSPIELESFGKGQVLRLY
ncbi:MAG TPA: hypothetical protein VJ840_18495 [Gemmatimonadaceae bacterium]|nr:hypothetical protein [Gemmatimonadaceae bacterium]